jgi:hypothetical protein
MISIAYDMPFLFPVKGKKERDISVPTCLFLGGNAPSEEKRGGAPQLRRGALGLEVFLRTWNVHLLVSAPSTMKRS